MIVWAGLRRWLRARLGQSSGHIPRQEEPRKPAHPEVIGQAIELSRTPWSIRSATPEPGEHTDAVLGELLGLSAGEISRLREGKIL